MIFGDREREGGRKGWKMKKGVERKECWEVTWGHIILLNTAVITEKCKM